MAGRVMPAVFGVEDKGAYLHPLPGKEKFDLTAGKEEHRLA